MLVFQHNLYTDDISGDASKYSSSVELIDILLFCSAHQFTSSQDGFMMLHCDMINRRTFTADASDDFKPKCPGTGEIFCPSAPSNAEFVSIITLHKPLSSKA